MRLEAREWVAFLVLGLGRDPVGRSAPWPPQLGKWLFEAKADRLGQMQPI